MSLSDHVRLRPTLAVMVMGSVAIGMIVVLQVDPIARTVTGVGGLAGATVATFAEGLGPGGAELLAASNSSFEDAGTSCPGGGDHDTAHGIDIRPLFFFAGHGGVAGWALKDEAYAQLVDPRCMALGNDHGGGLRYYFQCSCQVFAHGPCKFTYQSSTNPDDFACGDGRAVTYPEPFAFGKSCPNDTKCSDVFKRWGPALGRHFRIACGGSTDLSCSAVESRRFWHMYDRLKLGVADSFLFGFYSDRFTPLCISTGSEEGSPLFDSRFIFDSASSAGSHLYIQYTVLNRDDSGRRDDKPVVENRGFLPVLFSTAFVLDWRAVERFLADRTDWRARRLPLPFGLDEEIEPLEGPVRLESSELVSDEFYRQKAWEATEDNGWLDVRDELGRFDIIRVMVDRVRRGGSPYEVEHLQRQIVALAGKRIGKAVSLDSRILIVMDYEGREIGSERIWLRAGPQVAFFEALAPPAACRREDMKPVLPTADGAPIYELVDSRLVYRVLAVGGSLLEVPFYQCDFAPTARDARGDRYYEAERREVPAATGMPLYKITR